MKDPIKQQGFRERISLMIHRVQSATAEFAGTYANKASSKVKVVVLTMFILAASGTSLFHLLRQPKGAFNTGKITRPVLPEATGDNRHIITEAEYKEVHRYRLYLDSLARSPSGRKAYYEILAARPGLMDSILQFEQMYQSQIKSKQK